MKKRIILTLACSLGLTLVSSLLSGPAWAQAAPAVVQVLYPQQGTVFAKDLPAPALRWTDTSSAISWRVSGPGVEPATATSKAWRPAAKWWQELSAQGPATLTLEGLDAAGAVVSKGEVKLGFEQMPPRELLYFLEQPNAFGLSEARSMAARWRLGPLAAEDSGKVLLKGLPGCVVCHSFSSDGSVLALGVGPTAGSVAVAPMAEELRLDTASVRSWADLKLDWQEPLANFGSFSVLSPDGRFLLGTVQDRLALVPQSDQKPWSAYFLPVRGALAFRNLETGELGLLPGASLEGLVQANPSWSPDSKELLFVKAPKVGLGAPAGLFLSTEEAKLFHSAATKAQYEIFKLAFNNGKGGEAVPLKGASGDANRNFYPRWSPDGKWVVFCRSMPGKAGWSDPELYIVPAEGGTARRMNCNQQGLNTWHSFSADGRWMVFSAGKADQPSKLYLTRVEESGEDHPAVLLENFSRSGFSLGLPEFLHGPAQAPRLVDVSAVASDRNVLVGQLLKQGDYQGALAAAEKRLESAPEDADAHMKAALALIGLGRTADGDEHWKIARKAAPEDLVLALNHANYLLDANRLDEALVVFEEVREGDPTKAEAYLGGGLVKYRQGLKDDSIGYWLKAVELDPTMTQAHFHLGSLLLDRGNLKLADKHLTEAAKLEPRDARILTSLAMTKFYLGKEEEAIRLAKLAIRYEPMDPTWPDLLASMYAEKADFSKAAEQDRRALRLATLRKMEKFASVLEERIKAFDQGKPWEPQAAPAQEAPPAGGDGRQVEQK
jgi:tetratricopeptide (TPR) repeat protein